MSLQEYQRKRRLGRTPEPLETPEPATSDRRRFCLQRHQASRLHYDLRLEMGGVLKSWAVPKGPSLTPLLKRLAVPTEDHPLAYLDWEGVIPAGEYGAGVMMVYDIGEWEPVLEGDVEAQLKAGELKLRLWGSKVSGESTLVRTNLDNSWLWLKKDDPWCDPEWDPEEHLWSAVSGRTPEEVAAGVSSPAPRERLPAGAQEAPLPLEVEPMLAVPAKPFDDQDWLYELKWDGIRALAFARDESLRLVGRRGTVLTGHFPELRYLRAHLAAESFVIDGELVVLDGQGRPDFSRVLSRLKAPSRRAFERLARSDRATYYVFDLLYLDGHDLRNLPLERRRSLLEQAVRPNPWIRISDTVVGQGTALFQLVTERGLEGLVAKHRHSLYLPGRSPDWKKLKVRHTTEAVVVGYTPHRAKAPFGALHLARYVDSELVAVGKVGSGFSAADQAEVLIRLQPLRSSLSSVRGLEKHRAAATWVEPEVVIEVEFAEQTKDGLLRHATFLRLRDDLTPQDCSDDPPQASRQYLEVDGRNLSISNPGRVLFPEVGVRKKDLVDYYQQVGPLILTHLKDRPLSLRRFPDGIEGPDFFQKHPPAGTPDWVRTAPTEHGLALLADDFATLVFLANLASVEVHATLSRLPTLSTPDGFLIDLDPQDAPFSLVRKVAATSGEILRELGWTGYLKTSGSRGIHVFVPLAPEYSFEQSRMVASVIAEILSRRLKGQVTLERVPAKRPRGTVYVDAPQNRSAATMACAYSVRATPGATFSMPLAWEQLESDLTPLDFSIAKLPAKLADTARLWSMQPSPEQHIEEALLGLEEMLK